MHEICLGIKHTACSKRVRLIRRLVLLSAGICSASIILQQPVFAAASLRPSTVPVFDKGHFVLSPRDNGVAVTEPLMRSLGELNASDEKPAVSASVAVQGVDSFLTPVSMPTKTAVQTSATHVEVIAPEASGSEVPEPTTWAMLIVGLGVVTLRIRGMNDRSNRIH